MTGGETLVSCPLRAATLATPDAPAIVSPDGPSTYAELDLRVSAAARAIEALDLGAGTRVALYLPKDERCLILLLALIRAGYVAAPLSTRLPPRSVEPLLQAAGCRALVSSDEDLLGAAGADVERLRPEELLGGEAREPRSSEALFLSLDQPATVVSTSVSTATPKAALHTFGNHYHSARGSNANIALSPGDLWLHSLPLYHVGGLSILFRCLLAGAGIALPNPEAYLAEAISESGATHVSLVATQLRRLLREGREGATEFGPLKAVLLGGGPVPVPLVEEALARGLPVHTSYGLTEMSSQVTTTPPGSSPAELRTSGRPLPHREVSVAEDGEIRVKGETLFAGYVEGGEVNLTLDGEGWFRTGDLGELDAEGYLSVLGRRDNMFVSGGENVQPEEIEDALRRLAGVEDAVVVAVPDETFGARPVTFVRAAGGVLRPGELARGLGETLPRFKVPDAFHPWPDGDEGMKPDRAALGDLARRWAARSRRGGRDLPG